ncbi:cytotoxin [Bacillus cereus group sp. MYBK185-1]|uniref:cytotoxin n=1 Tax=Bacillus cereus group sp. MYBK185-1 TaxID=3450672 RepID=UPI003F7AB9C2
MEKKIIMTEHFKRAYKKQGADKQKLFKKTIEELSKNPTKKSLRVHPIKHTNNQVYEASPNMSLRITFQWTEDKQGIILRNCGPHDSTIKNP